jgi:hypothetical protein
MNRDSVDRLQLVFIVIVAVAAVAIAVIASHIVDSSYEHVKEIKQANIEGTTEDLSMDIVKNADDAKTILAKTGSDPDELRFSDQTITRTDLRLFVDQPRYTRLKMLRCDFNSKDFDVLKDSQIKTVSLSDEPVDKALIDCLVAMPKLSTLEMFRCDIQKTAFGNLGVSKIHFLKLKKCGETVDRIFTRQLVKDIARMPSLLYAELSKNNFEDNALTALSGAQCLILDLAKTNVSDADLETVKQLPRLQYLQLDDCAQVTCAGLKSLESSSSLQHVRTTVSTASCGLSPGSLKKFQANLYQVPAEYHF